MVEPRAHVTHEALAQIQPNNAKEVHLVAIDPLIPLSFKLKGNPYAFAYA